MTLRAPLYTRIPRQDYSAALQMTGGNMLLSTLSAPLGKPVVPNVMPNPRIAQRSVDALTWTFSIITNTGFSATIQPVRNNFHVMDVPRAPQFPISLRTWIDPFKLNLLSQDQRFANVDFGPPPLAARFPYEMLQIGFNLLQSTLAPAVPTPIFPKDFQNPRRPATNNLNLQINLNLQTTTLPPSAGSPIFNPPVPNPVLRTSWQQALRISEQPFPLIHPGAPFAPGQWIPIAGGATYTTYYINDSPPVQIATIPTQVWLQGTSVTPLILDDYVQSLFGDTLVWTGALPLGIQIETVTYNVGQPNQRTVQQLDGIPLIADSNIIGLTATDYAGESVMVSFNYITNPSAQMPNLVGQTYPSGVSTLTGLGVTDIDFLPGSGAGVGIIVAQSPAPGAFIGATTTATLTVSGFTIPLEIGNPLGAATTALMALGLTVNSNGSDPSLIVTDQSLPNGTFVFQLPTTITLTVVVPPVLIPVTKVGRTILKPKLVGENILVTFDFISDVAVGETISSPIVGAIVRSGIDPSPDQIVLGSAVVSGTKVQQKIQGGVIGVIYELTCQVSTSLGQTLQMAASYANTPNTP